MTPSTAWVHTRQYHPSPSLGSHKTVPPVTYIQKHGRTAAHTKRPFELHAQILSQYTFHFRVRSIRLLPASYRADNKLSLTTSRHTPHQQCRYAAFYCPSAGVSMVTAFNVRSCSSVVYYTINVITTGTQSAAAWRYNTSGLSVSCVEGRQLSMGLQQEQGFRPLSQCFSTAGPRPGTGLWHQLYQAAKGSPGICHFSFLSNFH